VGALSCLVKKLSPKEGRKNRIYRGGTEWGKSTLEKIGRGLKGEREVGGNGVPKNRPGKWWLMKGPPTSESKHQFTTPWYPKKSGAGRSEQNNAPGKRGAG